ncbi:MAG TPA: hypothetical protein VFA46_18740 [Actinomycetes bacterium]|nr:hypothetical protein [Actinomycetes bacterium]
MLLRAGLERLLVDGGFEVVGTVGDGPALIAAVRRVAGGGTALDPEVVAQLLGLPDTPTDHRRHSCAAPHRMGRCRRERSGGCSRRRCGHPPAPARPESPA